MSIFAPIFNIFSLKLRGKPAPFARMAPAKRFPERVMCHELSETFHELMRALARSFDRYYPERHYMRGPGPKCEAKSAALSALPSAEGAAVEAHA